MTFTSTDSSSSILENGKLKPGVYKIQNLYAQTYLDIHEHSRELCCHSAQDLGEGRGLWEIKPLGGGYTVQRVEHGKPEQFCAPMAGLENKCAISVAAYPVAWRVEIVNDGLHRGFEYVRIYWGTTKRLWDVPWGKSTRVQFWTEDAASHTWWIWKLIPVKVEGTPTPSRSSSGALVLGTLPPYDEDAAGQSSTRAQHTESERDEFGTIVNEITVLTTTITTRKRYRVEDA